MAMYGVPILTPRAAMKAAPTGVDAVSCVRTVPLCSEKLVFCLKLFDEVSGIVIPEASNAFV